MSLIEPDTLPDDESLMARAVARADHSRLVSPPNPWVGAVLVTPEGVTFEGSTRRPGQNHAEREVLAAAGDRAPRGRRCMSPSSPVLITAELRHVPRPSSRPA